MTDKTAAQHLSLHYNSAERKTKVKIYGCSINYLDRQLNGVLFNCRHSKRLRMLLLLLFHHHHHHSGHEYVS